MCRDLIVRTGIVRGVGVRVGLMLSGLALVAGCDQAAGQNNSPAAGSSRAAAEHPASARVTRVESAKILETDAELALRLPGEVEGWRDAQLAAPLGGYIESISVEVGQDVKKGQTLARVDSAPHLARLSQAKVELEQAERELTRAKALGAAIPDIERDNAQSRLDAAEAAVRTAKVNVARTVIASPFAGTLAAVSAEVGETAAPGAPLMRLVQLQPVKVTVSVPGRDVVALEEGLRAQVRADALGEPSVGTVSRIRPAADLKTRSFIVEIRVENTDRKLLPGMIASVTLRHAVAQGRLIIPQDWVVTGLEKVGVFLNEGGVARFRPVQLGQVVGEQVVVSDGLTAGAEVVITGHRDLSDGDPLLVTRTGTCCKEGRVSFD